MTEPVNRLVVAVTVSGWARVVGPGLDRPVQLGEPVVVRNLAESCTFAGLDHRPPDAGHRRAWLPWVRVRLSDGVVVSWPPELVSLAPERPPAARNGAEIAPDAPADHETGSCDVCSDEAADLVGLEIVSYQCGACRGVRERRLSS